MTLVTMMQVTAMTLVTKMFYPSHRQLNKAALFILIYDKDQSSGCTLHADKRLTYIFPSFYPVLKIIICDQCHKKMVTFPVASFFSSL